MITPSFTCCIVTLLGDTCVVLEDQLSLDYSNSVNTGTRLNPLVTSLLQITPDFPSDDHKATWISPELHTGLRWWPPSTGANCTGNFVPSYLSPQGLVLSVHNWLLWSFWWEFSKATDEIKEISSRFCGSLNTSDSFNNCYDIFLLVFVRSKSEEIVT